MERLAGALIGSYRLTRYLGSGGYGEVFLARTREDAGPRGFMVVKALQADRGDGLAQEALRTAERVAQVDHPNILRVAETGVDGRVAFIAMPYLPTGSIEALARTERVAPALVAPIITQVSQGLRAAHALGIVHGDLKPSNLFLHTEDGQPPLALVSDFGQAPLAQAALRGALQVSPNARQSPLWLARHLTAPEQFSGEALPASDQYALAAIACLLLTGRYPQQDANPRQPDAGQPLSTACLALLPAAIAPVLRRALAADPADRFSDIGAFASAFDATLAEAKGIMLAPVR